MPRKKGKVGGSLAARSIKSDVLRRSRERERRTRPMTKVQFRRAVMKDLGYTQDEILEIECASGSGR